MAKTTAEIFKDAEASLQKRIPECEEWLRWAREMVTSHTQKYGNKPLLLIKNIRYAEKDIAAKKQRLDEIRRGVARLPGQCPPVRGYQVFKGGV